MHVHITLVGGQPVPVYLGIKHVCPEKVVLICSPQSQAEAKRIQACCCKAVSTSTLICDPVNFSSIEKMAICLLEAYRNDQVSINLTSGTKPWSIFFYEVFRQHPSVDFFYVDQNNAITNFRTKKVCQMKLDTHLRFALYGTPLSHFHSFDIYTDKDKEVCMQLEGLRGFNHLSFNRLTTVLSSEHEFRVNNMKIGEIALDDGSSVFWNRDDETVHILLYNKRRQCRECTLQSPHVMSLVFFSGWFEYKVAEVFSHNEKVNSIWMNCVFAAQNNAPKNEVDIILDFGSKLFFIECKTQIKEISAIDKFHSVLKNFGGMGSKGLFVTYAPLKDVVLEKCKDNDILAFHFDSKQTQVKNRENLNRLVNTRLLSINKR